MMNWKFRIALLYAGFVAMILTLVVLAMRQKVDLVAPDYYAQELKYQERINRINRTSQLKEPLQWTVIDQGLQLEFPAEVLSGKPAGTVYFFRPSDAGKDLVADFRSEGNATVFVPFGDLTPGAYTLQISWESGRANYYNEGFILIP